ncbi:MAG: SDR family NAD(P)-dependent oxidoreductase [Bacteroidetes bacterium]|jgi:short-subunit dehydrogenase|nr:SDR family NAD(P)-dependent oxidoreductase [Bacteroidota bacterium]
MTDLSPNPYSPRFIITGASSGIGEELARQLANKGYALGLIARRKDRLERLSKEISKHSANVFIKAVDLGNEQDATEAYEELSQKLGGLDGIILNAGVGRDDVVAPWLSDATTIDINVRAFAHGMHWAFEYFKHQGHGHIIGMSSIAAHLASGHASAYTASKHFASNYMTGFRMKANAQSLKIHITDIRPGYVVSEMTQNNPNTFWMASTKRAVQMMVKGIESQKKRIYVTKRWYFIARFADLIPSFIWNRLSF